MMRSRLLRLVGFAAAVAFTSELLLNSTNVAMQELLVPLLKDIDNPPFGILDNIVSQIIFLMTGPVLIFTAIYFARTRHDPREYKTLLIMISSGAWSGYMTGAIVWLAIALATGIYYHAPSTTLESYYLPIWLPLQTLTSLSQSLRYAFVAFTALAISHIRRSKGISEKPIEIEADL